MSSKRVGLYRTAVEFLMTESLDDLETDISVGRFNKRICFVLDHDSLSGTDYRKIKRIWKRLDVEGNESYKRLAAETEREGVTFAIQIWGAFQCEIVDSREVEIKLTQSEIESRQAQIDKLRTEIESGSKTEARYEYSCTPAPRKA